MIDNLTLEKDREFEYQINDFHRIVELIYSLSGIRLSDRKEDMVYSRIARRLRSNGMKSFSVYLNFMEGDEVEKNNFVNALTTNLTHFFREEHHFSFLKKILFPGLFSREKKRIRIWSAGCSTGEEPYSLSMLWNEIEKKPVNIDFKILATDLDTNVLEAAGKGLYSTDKLEPIPDEYSRWYKKTASCSDNQREMSPNLKKNIHFKQLNLMNEWPMKGPFQVIICRNVLIYFDKQTQEKLINRYYDLIEKGGYLILGHSESLGANSKLFEALGKTVFRKIG